MFLDLMETTSMNVILLKNAIHLILKTIVVYIALDKPLF